ncbi:hypothetical protein PMEGAS70_22980 [Priestia megaterium]
MAIRLSVAFISTVRDKPRMIPYSFTNRTSFIQFTIFIDKLSLPMVKIEFEFIYHHNIKIYNFKFLPLNKSIEIALFVILLFNLSNF